MWKIQLKDWYDHDAKSERETSLPALVARATEAAVQLLRHRTHGGPPSWQDRGT